MHLTASKRAAITLALGATCVLAAQGLALPSAQAAPTTTATSAASPVTAAETAVARGLAASLADPGWRGRVRSAALGSGQVDLARLTSGGAAPAALAGAVTAADLKIAAAKGLGAQTGSLLRVRLGADSMKAALTPDTAPLVAVAADDDNGAAVTAYDSAGRAHTLSARQTPQQPVYVVDVDVAKATATGLAQVDKAFSQAGLSAPATSTTATTGGYWTTKINSVYLNDDEEPWILGDAEIFSLVSGFGFDGKVRVDTVDMPYLDNDHTTYYPNQILANWSSYKYNLADVVMMEDDGDTNYATLAKALADALLTITDQGAYVPLVDAILAAIPSSWYTNDADYVDSWYTLAQTSSGQLNGARGNGRMTVEPYFVQQF
ncbi:DUF3103 family protein [Actinacidiphila bryophytorum]|uniref:DUF3103 family protein n=1 Tax=Actinacidiphila bryophytorum TaxID=1436133 RepID=A0A9W4MGR2_9ACTN|nr:DUF3103 family protein [Actinacidiphila bryophytorum]CAG7640408.1 conserved exported hypothetical protein [Actinacidiphila bryophytorum]